MSLLRMRALQPGPVRGIRWKIVWGGVGVDSNADDQSADEKPEHDSERDARPKAGGRKANLVVEGGLVVRILRGLAGGVDRQCETGG